LQQFAAWILLALAGAPMLRRRIQSLAKLVHELPTREVAFRKLELFGGFGGHDHSKPETYGSYK
jgi:hypothetical protein